MIIYEDGRFETCSIYPDTLFNESAKYVISDESKLAYKYINIFEQGVIPTLIFDDEGNIIDVTCTEDELDKAATKDRLIEEIDILKIQLSSGDYKIIKCYEAMLAGASMPYDTQNLIQERDGLRKQINFLENELKNLD